VKKQSELYPLLATLKRLGMKSTRENYLAIDRWDNTDPQRKKRWNYHRGSGVNGLVR
jgi:hypothetical protein